MTENKKISLTQTPRYIALDILVKVVEKQAYSNLMLDQMLKKYSLRSQDRSLITELVYGTIARQISLQFFITPFIKNAKKVDFWVKQLLLLSVYQLEYLDKIPNHAILNEAVNIAKKKGNIGIGKFVNGVLRNYIRTGRPEFDSIADPIECLSTEISMPQWLTEKIIKQLGYKETKSLGLSLFEPSKISARFDVRKISKENAIEVLKDEGISVKASLLSPYGLVGKKGYLAGSTLFTHGEITIQDESSMLVAPAMQIKKHHKVLDACAAPGGKTTHIATFLDSELGGEVVALDIHAHKVKLIEDNAERLHVSEVVTAMQLDARKVQETFKDEFFDRILVDAPCSGLGLMRRKPDIKYTKKSEDFVKLQKIQLEILESVVTKVKVYGIITYSTCTITTEENQEVIERFLKEHKNYKRIEVAGTEQLTTSTENLELLLYPQQYTTDGFFICCLQRMA